MSPKKEGCRQRGGSHPSHLTRAMGGNHHHIRR
jgi:hypothetical protein